MQVETVTSKTNTLIAAAIMALHGFVLVAMPLVLLPQSHYWALLLVPLAFFNVTHWALIHEGVHKHLNINSRVNDYISRALSVLMGASFHVLKFAHLMHHKMNREWSCELKPQDNLKAQLNYFWTLLGGLYFTEVAGTFVAAILPKKAFLGLAEWASFKDRPDVLITADRFFYQRKNILATRVDALLIVGIYGAAFYLYGAMWSFLLAFLIGRALVISFMDNIYHYDTAADNTEAGKDLQLPKYVALAFLNGNYHETHHLNSNVPWRLLPVVQAEQQRRFEGGFIRHGLMQFKGPVVLKGFD